MTEQEFNTTLEEMAQELQKLFAAQRLLTAITVSHLLEVNVASPRSASHLLSQIRSLREEIQPVLLKHSHALDEISNQVN